MSDWNGQERRKGFVPNGQFEGYVTRALEDIGKRLDVLPCTETFKRLNKIENDVSNIKGKATVIGAISGAVIAIVVKIFYK